MKTTKCNICGKEITNCNYNKHILSHVNNPAYHTKQTQSVKHDGLNCIYCNRLCKNKNSLAQHECRCKENPNKIKIKTKGNHQSHQAWNKGLTKETDKRVAAGGNTYHKNHLAGKYDYSHNKHSQETKEKIRQQKLELCARQGTNLCGKGKRGYYKGYYCQSSWELAYVVYQLDHNVNFIRNTKRFSYTLDGINRSYFPDFYLIDEDIYIEIKGYYDNKTKEKEIQFPKTETLIVLQKQEMTPILEYVINKYGKNFIDLYEKH